MAEKKGDGTIRQDPRKSKITWSEENPEDKAAEEGAYFLPKSNEETMTMEMKNLELTSTAEKPIEKRYSTRCKTTSFSSSPGHVTIQSMQPPTAKYFKLKPTGTIKKIMRNIGAKPKTQEFEKIYCEHCPLVFESPEDYKNHSCNPKKYKLGNNVVCTKCKRTFQNIDLYQAHTHQCVLHVTNQASPVVQKANFIECENCKRFFNSVEMYNSHKCCPQGKGALKSGSCTFCTLSFQTQQEILHHVIDNHGNCSECQKIFLKRSSVFQHILEKHRH